MGLITKVSKWVWVLWYTLPYLLFTLLKASIVDKYWDQGRLVLVVKGIPIGYKETSGQAVGMVLTIIETRRSDKYLYEHEFEHTRQALRWGPLWPFVYFGAICYTRIKTKSWKEAYYLSRYEVLARKAERAS